MYKYILILLSFIISANSDIDKYKNQLLLDSKANTVNNSTTESFMNVLALEETIDQDSYIVGPGDIFLFNMISSDGMITSNISISPLGTVLIPNVGDIYVDKLSISQAFEHIKSKCLSTYSNAKINLTLSSIRKFKILVTGPVKHPGNIVVDPLTRVSDIYELVNDVNIDGDNQVSTRNIQLIRDSIAIRVDLLPYYILGNKDSNPFVKQGDIIKFKIKDRIITIKGGIKIPGDYEYVQNESLSNLINLANGFTETADSNYVHITRFKNEKDTQDIILDNFNLFQSFILNSSDYIHIRYKKDFKRVKIIRIDGEVNYPGYYPFSESTTVSDILKLSGNYTNKADKEKIVITNDEIVNNIDTEYQRIMLIEDENRTASERSYIKSRNKIKRGLIISEDIERTDKILDYIIQEGDYIYIPKLTNYIEILGSVKFPGRYPFDKNMSVNDYILEAGGMTKNSKNKMYVIDNASNQKLKINKKENLNNGDILFIENKEDFSPYNRFKEIMQILAQAATIVAVINIK